MSSSSNQDQVARETFEGHVIYPDKLPKARKQRAELWALGTIILAISFAGSMNSNTLEFTKSLYNIVSALCCFVCLLVLFELCKRILLLMEDKNHLMGRYDGKWSNLLKQVTNISGTALLVIIPAFLFMFMRCIQEGSMGSTICSILEPLDIFQMFLVQFASYLLIWLVRLDRCQLSDSVFLDAIQPLDYGSGMALNFFYGYLRLVVPKTGDKEKGLEERINDYIAAERLEDDHFPVKKLFILIPSSTFVPTDLADVSFQCMEAANNLEKQVKDRAGVKDRVYKNSVYKIQDPQNADEEPTYVVAEGATPLKTLNEVIMYSGEKREFFKKHQKSIIFSFYERLREIIREHPDCRDLIELVYYVDMDEYGNKNINVATKLLERIDEIRSKEAFLEGQRQIRT